MDCQDVYKLMNRYIDQEITLEEERVFEFHLGRCLKCQKEFSGLKELSSFLDTLEPPRDFTDKVMARIQEEKNPFYKKWKFKSYHKWVGVAATIILCIFLMSSLGSKPTEMIISSGQVETQTNEQGQQELTVIDGEIIIKGLEGTFNAINSQIYLDNTRADLKIGIWDKVMYKIQEIFVNIKNAIFNPNDQ